MHLTPSFSPRRLWLALAAAALTSAGGSAARAQSVIYTFSGTVTTATNPSGPWAGVQVGDQIRMAVVVYTTATPSSSTATSVTYAYPNVFAFQPSYTVAGPYRADFFYGGITFESGEIIIADDDGSPPQDLFHGRYHADDGSDSLFEYHETAPSTPVPTGLTGLGWPSIGALDLSTWASTRLQVTGDFGSGPMTISGSIESAWIQSTTCAPIDYTEDGIIDFSDYLQFLNYYIDSDPRADLCGCGIVDFQSYLEFLNLYDHCGGQ